MTINMSHKHETALNIIKASSNGLTDAELLTECNDEGMLIDLDDIDNIKRDLIQMGYIRIDEEECNGNGCVELIKALPKAWPEYA